MKKSKIIWLSVLATILIFLITIISIFFAYFYTSPMPVLDIIGKRWGIDFPECTEIYKTQTHGDPFGKDQKYLIYEFKTEPIDFLNDFNKKKDKILENELLNKVDTYNKLDLNLADEYLIDLSTPYYSRRYNEDAYSYLYLFYFPNNKHLIIFENLI